MEKQFLVPQQLISECSAKPNILCGSSSSHQYAKNLKKPFNFDTFPFCSMARNLSSPKCSLLALLTTLNQWFKFVNVTYVTRYKYFQTRKTRLTCSDEGTTTPCEHLATISSLTVSQIFKGCSQIFSKPFYAHFFLKSTDISSILTSLSVPKCKAFSDLIQLFALHSSL